MAEEKPSCSYEETMHGKYVKGLDGKEVLQLEAIKQGEGALALLLNSKPNQAKEVAETFAEIKFVGAEQEVEMKIALEQHMMEMRKEADQHQLQLQMQQMHMATKQKQRAIQQPEYIVIPDDNSQGKQVDLLLKFSYGLEITFLAL